MKEITDEEKRHRELINVLEAIEYALMQVAKAINTQTKENNMTPLSKLFNPVDESFKKD